MLIRAISLSLITWIACSSLATSATRHVVVLYDERTALPGLAAMDASIISTLTSESSEPVQIYSEGMDLSRFGSAAHLAIFRDYLRTKYADRKVDVAIAVLGPPLDFLLNNGQTVFPGAAIVFCGVDKRELGNRSLPSNTTGVLLKRHFAPTLDIALRLQPDTERVVVVAGTSKFDADLLEQAREEFRPYEDHLAFTYLTTLPLSELLTRLSQLPPHTIALYTTLFKDGAGQAFVSHDVVKRVSAAANAPLYSFVDQYLGLGIVGGSLYSFTLQGQEAAKLAAQILAGAKPSELPILAPESTTAMFDWRQLQRWELPESLLPIESEVRFREPTLWERYRLQVTAISAFLLLQSALIFWLLYEQGRRSRSETDARELSRRLINSHEEERARLARELHDDLTQRLAALAINAARHERETAGVTRDALHSIHHGLVRLSDDVHALSYRLHPSILTDLGLIEALKSECDSYAQSIPHLKLDAPDIPENVPEDAALCIYRVAQEGLRNVARHSGASQTEVALQDVDQGLRLTVRDNGAGFDTGQRREGMSLGLASMRQRVISLGGRLDIESSPGRGTTIQAWIPLKNATGQSLG